jgi:thiamine-phosphate pyrophosphorylase
MAFRGNPAEIRHPVPRLYLVTPQAISDLAGRLAEALGAADIAAVLLRAPDATDEHIMVNEAKALAPVVQNRGAAFLLDGTPNLVERVGADGAHLYGVEALKLALPALKPERIAGCGRLATRHEAMIAGEAGADYVMFGEPGMPEQRASFQSVQERVAWWADLFEIPCVGFAQSLEEVEPLAAAGADFVAIGDFVFADRRGCALAVADAAHRLAPRNDSIQ